jgi:hypothetical protein
MVTRSWPWAVLQNPFRARRYEKIRRLSPSCDTYFLSSG